MFFWQVIFLNGSSIGGHNCTEFYFKDGHLIIRGYDESVDYEGDYIRHYYKFDYPLSEIESTKFEVMIEEDDW